MVTNPSCCLSTLGSSKGHGIRAAGWFDDLIKDRNVDEISSIVLTDGIAGWAMPDKTTSLLWRNTEPILRVLRRKKENRPLCSI